MVIHLLSLPAPLASSQTKIHRYIYWQKDIAMATATTTKKPAVEKTRTEKWDATKHANNAWRGFKPGLWQRDINVRWFLQQHYAPYDGDAAFLKPATDRTKRIWKTLEKMFIEERKKGVLDVSPIPSSI